MNGCTPTFSSNKLCLLGITLRKWPLRIRRFRLPTFYACSLARSNLLIEGITRLLERTWRMFGWPERLLRTVYIYIRFPIFQLYLSRIASETLLLDKSSVSSSGSLEKNRVFTEGFSTWSFATRNEFEIASRIHGFRIVTSGKGRTWIHLVEKLSLMVYRSVDVSSTSS